jgi:hypothetical protein
MVIGWEEEFCKIDHVCLFNPEKALMFERFGELAASSNQHHQAAEWRSQRVRALQRLKAEDSITHN